jgi:hypothetical protein
MKRMLDAMGERKVAAASASVPRFQMAECFAYFLDIPICFGVPFGALDCSTEHWG